MLDQTSNLKQLFSHRFLSYELGMMKPEERIFQAVCNTLALLPEEMAFFDDSNIHVQSARLMGLHAWRVESPEEIQEIVYSHELFQ
jgi:putative hydrolase of the HAD superfamily